MISSKMILPASYDYRLVAVSVLISVFASYAALDLSGRVTAARGWMRSAWLSAGAAAMGIGIWSMHFTGMLAFSLPVPVAYHWPTVLLSLTAAIIASAVALYVVSREKVGRVQALIGSVLMALAIVGMHYIGMAAMRLSAVCHYSPLLVAVSVMIAIIASLAALEFTFNYREDFRGTTLAKVLSAAVMGAAISLMHYTGMMSASFTPSTVLPEMSHAVSISSLGLSGIAIGTLVVQGVAILTTSVDRRIAAQGLQLQSIDAIPQQIWSARADGVVDFCNQRWRSSTGLELKDLQGDGWHSMLHPDDRSRVVRAWQESAANGAPYEQEERHREADGHYRWYLARAVPLRNAGGNIVRWYGTNTDIEDLKRAEEALRQAEDRIRLVINTIPTMVWTLQPDGTVDFVNQRSLDYTGLSLAEQLADPTRALHPEDLPRVMEKWLADLAAGQASEDEMRMRRADGEYRWFLIRTVPLRDDHGKLVKWYGVSIDIEDRKRAEEALRSSEREQRHIAAQLERERARLVEAQEMAKIGSWEAELQSLNVIWSDQTHRIFETDPARFHPTRPKFCEFIRPDDRAKVDAAFVASLDKRSPSTVEYRIVMPDGRVKILEERWQAFHDEEGKPVRLAGTCRDITERVRAEEELQRLSGKLLRLQDEERRKIASDLHDNTGQELVVLATTLGQLHNSLPSSSRKLRKLISQCQEVADRCIREVRTLSYVLYPPCWTKLVWRTPFATMRTASPGEPESKWTLMYRPILKE